MNEAALAERVARESYGRLLALLAARTRDVAAAEDALADAFAAALTAWPRIGAPEKPEAWLFAAAKRKLIDSSRRARTASVAQDALALAAAEIEDSLAETPTPDRRLDLMFACAHPDIDANARTPLMLQTVLGFSAERIAAAFLVAPASMSQRLVRAKRRIAEARLSFETPSAAEWPRRLEAVLEAIYAAYAEGWADAAGADPTRAALAEEGLWLGRVLAAQAPKEPEALGLLALILHLEARRPARRVGGRFWPLNEQDVSLWNVPMQEEAETLLYRAVRARRFGRFQLEAAIQSAHAARRPRGAADWDAIVTLYDGLAALTPSPVVQLNRAAALARRDGAEAGQAALAALNQPVLQNYQPYWAPSVGAGGNFAPGVEKRWKRENFKRNPVTHDKERHARGQGLIAEEPRLATAGPTIGWVAAAADATEGFLQPGALAHVRIPILIATAAQELLVDNKSHEAVIEVLPDATQIVIPGAKHEILMERDEVRAQFWEAFDALAERVAPRQA